MRWRKYFSVAALATLTGCSTDLNNTVDDPVTIEPFTFIHDQQKRNLEESLKDVDERDTCLIDLSNNFTPELFKNVKDGEKYFSTEGKLVMWRQRLRFGLFHSFPKQMQEEMIHYKAAIERRGDQEQPKIEFEGRVKFTTTHTLTTISELEAKTDKNEKEKKQLEKLKKNVETVKNIQQILKWEGFHKGEITGVYSDMTYAVVQYKRFHTETLDYQFLVDEGIREWTGMEEMLNKSFEDYADRRFMKVLKERVKHMLCYSSDGATRRPMVINEKHLATIMDDVKKETDTDTVDGMIDFLEEEHGTLRMRLKIPDFYKRDFIKYRIVLEKWEKDRSKTKLIIYTLEDRVNEDGEITEKKWEEYFRTKAVVGGKQEMPNETMKMFHTPEGIFYIKSFWWLPHWHPVERWSDTEHGEDEPQTQPGPENAFGMGAMPIFYTADPQENPYRGWQEDDRGYRLHGTRAPWSVERGGTSHGCGRFHPDEMAIIHSLQAHTPHMRTMVYDREEGKMILKHTPAKGTYIPITDQNYFIQVQICAEACKIPN
jgi:hypothetical protein